MLISPRVGLSLQTLILLWVAATEDFFLPPHLPSEPTESFDQSSSRSWIPGRTTKLAFLKTDLPLDVRIKVFGREKYAAPQFYSLEYKCDSREPAYQQVKLRDYHQALSYIHPVWTKYCNDSRHFQLKSLGEDQFELMLSSNWSSVPLSESFTLLLELRLRVEYPMNRMTSASLFISNFDAVLSMNSRPEASAGLVYTRYILTQEAVEFLAGLSSANFTSSNFLEINFIEKSFYTLVKNAPLLIQNLLSITIRIESIDCQLDSKTDPSQMGSSTASPVKTLMNVTKSMNATECPETLVISSVFGRESEWGISLENGTLHAFPSLLHRLNFFQWRKVRVSIELAIAEKASYASFQNYTVRRTVMEYVHKVFFNLSSNDTSKGLCFVSKSYLFLYHFALEGKLVLWTPVICSREKHIYKHFKVFINGKFCSNEVLQSSKKCNLVTISDDYRWVSINTLNKVAMQLDNIEFRVSMHTKQSHLKDIKQKIIMHHIQPARFATEWEKSPLPKVTTFMLNMPVILQCNAYWAGFNTTIEPMFEVSPDWKRITLYLFASYLNIRLNEVTVERSVKRIFGDYYKSQLTIRLPAVLKEWIGYNFVFVCLSHETSVSRHILGIPSYSTETFSLVSFSGQRSPYKLASRQSLEPNALAAAASLMMLPTLWTGAG